MCYQCELKLQNLFCFLFLKVLARSHSLTFSFTHSRLTLLITNTNSVTKNDITTKQIMRVCPTLCSIVQAKLLLNLHQIA